ncbi:WD40/YVTN/BNR-like repeat-containing protein [Kamptonema formosum]|uniref:WD40/YVTN/BNR-like repeat-containing protein n=1 Tax=Kamptonema formosum TaxID=331992 RepID=UPI00034A6DA2|nr:sialidase family protein [Oscillatoria sp. PCC 10802]
MSVVLAGTDSGVFRWESPESALLKEESSPPVSFLAAALGSAFAISQAGALWARTGQGDWQLVSERPVAEEVWSFAADPSKLGRLYLGVSPALLHISDDGGQTWSAVQSIKNIPGYSNWTFPPPPHIPHVRYIAPDPQVPGGVYIGVEEGGVYRSEDGNQSWESLNQGLYWDVHTVIPLPNSSKLYATTGNGFYRSDDGGLHWQHMMRGLERSYTVPCAVMPGQPERVYTAAAAGPPPTWAGGANAAIYRSDDGGELWVQLRQGLPESFDEMVRLLAIDETGSIWAAAGHQVFCSANGGESWELVAKDLPAVRALAAIGP